MSPPLFPLDPSSIATYIVAGIAYVVGHISWAVRMELKLAALYTALKRSDDQHTEAHEERVVQAELIGEMRSSLSEMKADIRHVRDLQKVLITEIRKSNGGNN